MIEHAHDQGIAVAWPKIEPVESDTCINPHLLHSAAEQPYLECFGREMYPTIPAKAAYLFYHLITAHIFSNGNKRTAVLCLDVFLNTNGHVLLLSNEEIYDLAKRVAAHGERGQSFRDVLQSTTEEIDENAMPFFVLREDDPREYRSLHRMKTKVRTQLLTIEQRALNRR